MKLRHNSSTAAKRFFAGDVEPTSARGFSKRTGKHLRLEVALQMTERDREILAQHGPARILFKDGKPVPQEQQNGR